MDYNLGGKRMIVYVDLIFLLNLLIDVILLQTTAWARKIRASPWRILTASVIGAMYVVMMFFPVLSFMFAFMIKLLFSLLMIWTAFGFGSLQNFLRNLGVFYVISFVAAGGIFAIYYALQSSHEVMDGILFTQSGGYHFELKIGGIFILITLPLVIMLYRQIVSTSSNRELLTSFLAKTSIYIEDHSTKCIGLIDTGNQLYDPLTRTPVMIMEIQLWKDIFPDSWIRRIQEGNSDQMMDALGKDEFKWQDRLRFVPYKGIHENSQFMLAIKPDRVVITHGENTIETHKVWIGLKGGKLCSDNSYQAIIHPALTETLGR